MKLTEQQEWEKTQILAGHFQHYPVLPMKRWKDGEMDCGILVAPHYNKLLIANMWFMTDKEYINSCPVMIYADLDELLLDGWRGD